MVVAAVAPLKSVTDPGGVLRGWRSETVSPSSTIYVEAPLARLIVPHPDHGMVPGRAPPFEPGRPVRALTPNAFHAHGRDGHHAIVVRDWSAAARRRIERIRDVAITYVIDDDVAAGAADERMPFAYRGRLARLLESTHAQMMKRAERVLTPSIVLSERLEQAHGRPVETLTPTYAAPPAGAKHHDERPLRIIFPNTRSHLADWEAIRADVEAFLAERSSARLTTFLRGHLADGAGTDHRPYTSWPTYRDVLARERFHVVLLPGLASAFNAARSYNKLLETAAWGAVPVVSRHLPYAEIVEREGLGLVCNDRPGAWRDALEALQEPDVRMAYAKRTAAFARRVGDPAIMEHRWRSMLDLAPQDASAAHTVW